MISEAQNGFRQKKSTHTATQTFVEDIYKPLENKLFVMGIFLDLGKAFDVIIINCCLLHWSCMQLEEKYTCG
jgi:hypothetical protein